MTTTNPFDRPVWASLTSTPGLAEGGDLAKRYRRDVNLFASARDDADDASLAQVCSHDIAWRWNQSGKQSQGSREEID